MTQISNCNNLEVNEKKEKNVSIFEVLQCSLLIAGTCIGGGMLALPLSIGSFGFLPSLVLIFSSCAFMALSSLLYLEATLWMKGSSHMNTLSNTLLSKFWRKVSVGIYVFICYASIVAYLSWGGKELAHSINVSSLITVGNNAGIFLFTAFFGLTLVLGYKFLGRVNSILFAAMIFAYLFLIFSGTSQIEWINLKREDWSIGLFFTSPLMLAIFSFPGIVPSITYQLKRDARSVKLSILIGMVITLLVYMVWTFYILGSIPYDGTLGLKEACLNDIPISQCIHYLSSNPFISISAKFFTFFAIATSFLGISLSLFDFFFDASGAKKRNLLTDATLSLLVILPSLMIALLFEKVFVRALEVSGGFGDAILSGVIPILMIWNGRYKMNYTGEYKLAGGKPILIIILLIAISIFISEFITTFL